MDEGVVFAGEEPGLAEILAHLQLAHGVDLTAYRSGMVKRRLMAHLASRDIPSLPAYLEQLRADPAECGALVDAIAVNVTCFFRDPIVFDIIAQTAIPQTIAAKRKSQRRDIRIWSAGCSSGEEAYSLAILVHRALGNEAAEWSVLVLGTDIDRDALSRAEAGVYPRTQLLDVKLGLLDGYFEPRGAAYSVCPHVRRLVRFAADDLASADTGAPPESVFGEFDIVLCRNVLIYFIRAVQESICARLCRSTAPGGYLVLGDADALAAGVRSELRTLDARNRIHRRTPIGKRSR